MKLSGLILFLLSFHSFAQEWTLQQCMDSTLVNNREVQISTIQLDQSRIRQENAIYSFFPSLNAGVTHGYNWGQTIDPFTNQFATDRVQYNNVYLNSSVTLFAGFQNIHTKKLTDIDYQYQELNKALIDRDKRIELTTAFLQVNLNHEIVLLYQKALELTLSEQKRMEALLKEGFNTSSDLLKIKAQLAREEYSLAQGKNDYQYSLLLLQQLMGHEYDSTFTISNKPIVSIEEPLYPSSISIEKQLASLDSEKQKISKRITKGQLSPSITLNGSLGSGYSENNTILTPDGSIVPKSLNNQLTENFYQSVSSSLTIPIFNNNDVRTEIKLSELEAERIQIENEQSINDFENSIEQFEMDISNNESLFQSLNTVYESSKLDFENSKLLYENGSLNFIEFLRAKNALFEVESELIQAKYKLEFSKLIIMLIR